MRDQGPLRIVLIGPECTGKTTLAAGLAAHYGVPWSPEFARIFVEAHPRPVEYADVDSIGRGQAAREDQALAEARVLESPLVIHDTDLVSTLVYSRHYYGDCPAWISASARRRAADLYLLHDVDVPWADDGFQRAQPERRDELLASFASTLANFDVQTVLIEGSWAERSACAIRAINALVAAAA